MGAMGCLLCGEGLDGRRRQSPLSLRLHPIVDRLI